MCHTAVASTLRWNACAAGSLKPHVRTSNSEPESHSSHEYPMSAVPSSNGRSACRRSPASPGPLSRSCWPAPWPLPSTPPSAGLPRLVPSLGASLSFSSSPYSLSPAELPGPSAMLGCSDDELAEDAAAAVVDEEAADDDEEEDDDDVPAPLDGSAGAEDAAALTPAPAKARRRAASSLAPCVAPGGDAMLSNPAMSSRSSASSRAPSWDILMKQRKEGFAYTTRTFGAR